MNDIYQNIEHEIVARDMIPRPRWHFILRRSVFWSLAVASIVFGAIAFSVADYIFFDNEGMSPSVLLESPLEGIIQSLPILWILLFGIFSTVTYIGLRRTRNGYQYRTAGIVLCVLFVTIGLGLVLNIFDFGQAVHYYLLNHTGIYDALVHSSDDMH